MRDVKQDFLVRQGVDYSFKVIEKLLDIKLPYIRLNTKKDIIIYSYKFCILVANKLLDDYNKENLLY